MNATASKFLTPEQLQAIRQALAKGQRVELIPVKDGVKVMCIRREEIKYCASP